MTVAALAGIELTDDAAEELEGEGFAHGEAGGAAKEWK